MELTYLLEQLSTGELRKDVLGGQRDNVAGVKAENYTKIIPVLNLAILALHKRLRIRQESVTIELYDHITRYSLTSPYAESNVSSTQPIKYISDSVYMPFNPRILSVVAVMDMGGHALPINDDNHLNTIWTPTHNVVQHPYPTTGETMDVIYQSSIPNIPTGLTETEAALYDVDIPEYGIEAVLAFAQSRLMISTGMTENGNAEAFALSKFEMQCTQIERAGLIPDIAHTNTQISSDGWV